MTTAHPDAVWLSQVAGGLERYRAHPEWLASPTSSVTGGGAIQAAEDRFAAHVGVADAVLMPSATYAMSAVLRAVGVGPGDEVIVPELDWCANWAAVTAVGAQPAPTGVEPSTLTLAPEAVGRAITAKTKAVIATHIHGVPADVDGIVQQTGLPVIEDLTGAFGATLRGRPVGGLGHAAVLSLGPGKEIDCGEGAVVFTGESALWEQLIATTTHPVRQALSGLRSTALGEFSVRVHPLAAVLALIGLDGWDATERRERSRAAVTAARHAGLHPLVGGPERQLATEWIPIRSGTGGGLADFATRRSGARLLTAGGDFAPVADIQLVNPVSRKERTCPG